MILRDYQKSGVAEINKQWLIYKNIMYVLPCRGGKTAVLANIILNNVGGVVAIAHRSELVSQMSRTLARNGVQHKIIGSKTTVAECVSNSIREFGVNYVNQNSLCAVASVSTLVRIDRHDPWLDRVTLWVTDESHHLTKNNIWGQCVAKFKNARGLGVTATPARADGKGLGKHADGLIDAIVLGPKMDHLRQRGFLTNYRIFAPPSDIDLSNVTLSAGGDFSPDPLREAVHKSHITGDVVDHYLKIAPGEIGITFCVDVEAASATAAAFRQAGVPAEVISAKTPAATRHTLMQKHQRGDIKQLCNVDLFGEGVDIQKLSVVSMARPTQSFPLFYQQFCRCLNPEPGKIGKIIDHVGNVHRHSGEWVDKIVNLNWSLDRRESTGKSKSEKQVQVRTCTSCLAVYERAIGPVCPFCGESVILLQRKTPDQVDGNLFELSPEGMAALRGEIEAVTNEPLYPHGATPEIVGSIRKKHRERLEAIAALKDVMMLWAAGKTDIERAQREFYLTFEIDVGTAQTLKRKPALELIERIVKCLN